jgi:hypothetical protein
MRQGIIILFTLFISTLSYGQEVKISSREVHYDSILYFIEEMETDKIECFKIAENQIKKIYSIKNEDQKYIYGNPKTGVVKICLKKRYYKKLKIGDILKSDFYNEKNISFYVNECKVSKEIILNTYLKNAKKIEFVKNATEIAEIRLTKLDN